MLRKVKKRGFLLKETYIQPSIIELEKIEYDKLAKAKKNSVSEMFWEHQAKIENVFIGMLNRKLQ